MGRDGDRSSQPGCEVAAGRYESHRSAFESWSAPDGEDGAGEEPGLVPRFSDARRAISRPEGLGVGALGSVGHRLRGEAVGEFGIYEDGTADPPVAGRLSGLIVK